MSTRTFPKITGLYWDNGVPALHATPNGEILLSTGQYIELDLDGARSCIGSYNEQNATRIDCASQAIVGTRETSQCNSCEYANESMTARSGRSSSNEDEAFLTKEHMLYLALFGRDLVKVGVSRIERASTRLHEQGAMAALAIARCNGYEARRFEAKIHEILGIATSITARQKIELLGMVPGNEESKDHLTQKLETIFSKIDIPHQPLDRFRYFVTDYGLDADSIPDVVRYLYPENGGSLAATITGVVGKFALLEANHATYVLDGKRFEGYHYKRLGTDPRSTPRATLRSKTIAINKQGELF